MRARSSNSGRREAGFVLLAAAVCFIIAIPLVGLAIDVGILYMVQSKLQTAVDAGALAAARSLSRGNDDATQQQNAKTTATAYLNANFPSGYLGASSPTVTTWAIDESKPNVRSVSLAASVPVPYMFMAWYGGTSTNVVASATASRRDVNVVIVMDRSGSLANSGSCTPLKNAAVGFVSKFANGRDNVGLITFATSSRVDFSLANNFNTASPSVSSIITSVTCTGATSSAQALWQGYQNLASLNQPAALNVILFFTDGQPTAVTTVLPVSTSSSCNNKTTFTGVFTVGFQVAAPYAPVATGGIMDYNAPAQPIASDARIISGSEGDPTGCSFAASWNANWTAAANDIKYVPTTDIWGNNLNNGYQTVTMAGGGISVPSNSTGALNLIAASTNAADSAGARIRAAAPPGNGALPLSNIVVFSIGLGNSTYPANHDLLRRIANDPGSSSFNSSTPAGLYVYAPTSADLSNAFSRVASEILRLAK